MAETDIESLIRSLVIPLLKQPQALSITQKDDGRYHRYIIDVAPNDVGRLIGRQGHVAAALRTVVVTKFKTPTLICGSFYLFRRNLWNIIMLVKL